MVPVFSSWDQWDQAVDIRYGTSTGNQTAISYANKVGDLAQSSLLVSAIRWLGNVFPKAPLYVKETTGVKGESKNVPNHPLELLWKRPNKFYSGSTLKKGIAFSWVLRSEAFILKFFNNADTEPLELWWEPHWTIRPVWPIDGSEFIAYYEVNRDGQWLKIPVENVIHLRDGLNPYNQRAGFSGVPSILRELYGDNEAANYYATLMGGSAVPPFLVSLDRDMKINQGEIDAFTKDLIRKTSGKRKGQPIVAKGARAYKLGFNPRELDLRETRYMSEDRFCAVMGIPAQVLELGSGQLRSTYHNMSEAEARAWDEYVLPMLTHIEEELNVQLLSDWEGDNQSLYCQHDTSKIQALQEDETAKSARIGQQYTDGIIMRSEARAALNYGPSDGKENSEVDKIFKSESNPLAVTPPGNQELVPTNGIKPKPVRQPA
jgi:HK97 family phage portal protein